MKVHHWSDRSNTRDMSVSELIEYEVSSTASERGAIEDCEARIVKLTEILGKLADLLPEDTQKDLVKHFFHWRMDDK